MFSLPVRCLFIPLIVLYNSAGQCLQLCLVLLGSFPEKPCPCACQQSPCPQFSRGMCPEWVAEKRTQSMGTRAMSVLSSVCPMSLGQASACSRRALCMCWQDTAHPKEAHDIRTARSLFLSEKGRRGLCGNGSLWAGPWEQLRFPPGAWGKPATPEDRD